MSSIYGFLVSCLVFMILLVSVEVAAEEDRHCGRISGEVFKFPGEYFFFWANYEGKSDWEPGFIDNKKGCNANFVSVSLELYWPRMTPAGRTTVLSDKNIEHVSFSIEPLNKGNDGLLADRFLDWEFERFSVMRPVQPDYRPDIELFFIDVETGDSLVSIYWDESSGRVGTFVKCFSFRASGEYLCEQQWYFRRLNAAIELNYKPEMLKYWKSMRRDIESFIVSHKLEVVKEFIDDAGSR